MTSSPPPFLYTENYIKLIGIQRKCRQILPPSMLVYITLLHLSNVCCVCKITMVSQETTVKKVGILTP